MHAKIHVLKLFVFQCVCMTQDNVSVLGHKAGEYKYFQFPALLLGKVSVKLPTSW